MKEFQETRNELVSLFSTHTSSSSVQSLSSLRRGILKSSKEVEFSDGHLKTFF